MERYNFKIVEKKWQAFWEQNQTYKSEINNSVINTNINLCNVLNSFMLDGNYTNTYSEDLKVKNMILISRSKKKIIGLDGFGLKIKRQEIIK